MLLSAVSFLYVLYCGQNFPFQDDHRWVVYFSGLRTPPISWFWEAHAGHRIPVVRAITILVARLTNFDSRCLFLLTAAFLSAGSLILVLGVRRARGCSAVLDMIFPLYGASLLHYWNLLQGMQMFLGLYFFLVSMVIAGVLNRFWQSVAGVFGVGLAVTLLSVNGGAGLAASLVLLPYLIIVATFEFRQREGGGRRRALLLSAIALPGMIAAGFYAGPILARKIAADADGGRAPGAVYETMQVVLSRAWARWAGALIPDASPPGSWMIPVLIIIGLFWGLWTLVKAKRERPVVFGLFAVLVAVLGVAGAIALERGQARWGGSAIWYATLMAPIPCLLYLFADGAGRWPRRVTGLVLLFMGAAALAATWPKAWEVGTFRRRTWKAMREDLRRGVRFHEIHNRYQRAFLPWDQDGTFRMDPTLAMLKARGQGPFDDEKSQWLTGLEWTLHEDANLLDSPRATRGIVSLGRGTVTPVGDAVVLTVVKEGDRFGLPVFPIADPVGLRLAFEILSPAATEARLTGPGADPQSAPVTRGANRLEFEVQAGVRIRDLRLSPGRVPGNYRLRAIRLSPAP